MLTQQPHALLTLEHYQLVIPSHLAVQPAQNQQPFVRLWIAHKKPHQLELLVTNFGAKHLLTHLEITANMMQDQAASLLYQELVLNLYQLQEQLMVIKPSAAIN